MASESGPAPAGAESVAPPAGVPRIREAGGARPECLRESLAGASHIDPPLPHLIQLLFFSFLHRDRRVRRCHRLGVRAHVRDRYGRRGQVLGLQPRRAAGHREQRRAVEPRGCARCDRNGSHGTVHVIACVCARAAQMYAHILMVGRERREKESARRGGEKGTREGKEAQKGYQ